MVNTEQNRYLGTDRNDYNILNIVVNTEPFDLSHTNLSNYNILNIVVNTEQNHYRYHLE